MCILSLASLSVPSCVYIQFTFHSPSPPCSLLPSHSLPLTYILPFILLFLRKSLPLSPSCSLLSSYILPFILLFLRKSLPLTFIHSLLPSVNTLPFLQVQVLVGKHSLCNGASLFCFSSQSVKFLRWCSLFIHISYTIFLASFIHSSLHPLPLSVDSLPATSIHPFLPLMSPSLLLPLIHPFFPPTGKLAFLHSFFR